MQDKEKIILSSSLVNKESSLVNAKLEPRFEEKTPYYHLRVHFQKKTHRIWTGNLETNWDANFGSKILEANFKKRGSWEKI